MENVLVLYPSPGIGHLISMVELGKLILTHQPSFSITILIFPPPNIGAAVAAASATTQYISNYTASNPTRPINFHHLPPITSTPKHLTPQELFFHLPLLNNSNVYSALESISRTSTVKAFIIDMFCDASFDVASSLGIPIYYFFTSGAYCLAAFMYTPTLYKTSDKKFKECPDLVINIPGLPKLQASDMPDTVSDPTTSLYHKFLLTSIHMANSNGVLVNTFESLETKIVREISNGPRCPPVFCIGPLVSTSNIGPAYDDDDGEKHECLSWLDSQPSRSVVFLCFGSLGFFSAMQLKEMAIGLEKSGRRFLWVVRSPLSNQKTGQITASDDLDEILPESFMERTKERGLVVKDWAPQMAVLAHDSVGGFVTHCGWNSVLESVCAGVPMVAWPLYAEQKMNSVFMVEEMKVALRVNELASGLVTAGELEERVRELMDSKSERGRGVRERVSEMRDEAVKAKKDGGSSVVDLAKLGDLWRGK